MISTTLLHAISIVANYSKEEEIVEWKRRKMRLTTEFPRYRNQFESIEIVA